MTCWCCNKSSVIFYNQLPPARRRRSSWGRLCSPPPCRTCPRPWGSQVLRQTSLLSWRRSRNSSFCPRPCQFWGPWSQKTGGRSCVWEHRKPDRWPRIVWSPAEERERLHMGGSAHYLTLMSTSSYSLVLHWHQMRMASIWGDRLFFLVMPSSRARPACVAMPPHLLFLIRQTLHLSVTDSDLLTGWVSAWGSWLLQSVRTCSWGRGCGGVSPPCPSVWELVSGYHRPLWRRVWRSWADMSRKRTSSQLKCDPALLPESLLVNLTILVQSQ